MAKSIQEKQAQELTIVDVAMFEQDAMQESLGVDDLALPFLKVISGMEDYETGGKKGDIYNTVTSEVYSGADGIRIIPCAYQRRFIEWAPRGAGSGAPINIYEPGQQRPDTERDDNNRDMVVGGDGNYIEETHQHFCLLLNSEDLAENVLITMKSTQLKKSRKLNSMIASRVMKGANGTFTPPRFSHIYHLKTVPESNSKGNWYGWEMSVDSQVSDASLYAQAKSFADSITAGDVTVKHETDEAQETNHAF